MFKQTLHGWFTGKNITGSLPAFTEEKCYLKSDCDVIREGTLRRLKSGKLLAREGEYSDYWHEVNADGTAPKGFGNIVGWFQ